MSDISILSRLINGYQRNVDVSQNSLVVGSIKIGTSSPTEITKTIADKLVAISAAADSDGTYDTRYTTKTDAASTASGKGASLIGIQDTGSFYTSTTVEGALQELGSAVGSGDAASISFDPTGTDLAATNVQALGEELDDRIIATEIVANAAIPATEKGAANGVATLDGSSKVPVSQLPNSVMEYKGTYNATTNTPTLVDGTGNTGDVYRTTVAGAGVNSLNFVVGDYAIYNGSTWEKAHSGADAVNSVNGLAGIVVLTTNEISENVNLYFTDERAQDAVGAALTDTATIDTTYNDGANTMTFDVKTNALDSSHLKTTTTDQDTIVGGNGTVLSVDHAPKIQTTETAGESLTSSVIVALRYAKAADAGFTAGRMYKADTNSSSVDNFDVIGLARPSAGVSAGNPVTMVQLGLLNAPSHGLTVGQPIWLDSAGLITQTAPSAVVGTAVVKLGTVKDANNIQVKIQIIAGG